MHGMGLGFRHWWGSEVDAGFRRVNELLHPDCEFMFHDVKLRTAEIKVLQEERRKFPNKRLVYTAGFPCVAFSAAGKRQGADSPDGQLIFHGIALIASLKPDVYILENVPTLSTDQRHAELFKKIMSLLRGIKGYQVEYTILDSHSVGCVPQRRHRLYIVGVLKEKQVQDWSWPGPLPTVSLRKILEPRKPAEQLDITAASNTVVQALTRGMQWLKDNNKNWNKEPWVIDCSASAGWSTQPSHDVLPTITKSHADTMWVSTLKDYLRPSELLAAQGFSKKFIQSRPEFLAMCRDPAARTKISKMAGNAFTVTVVQRLLQQLLPAVGVKIPKRA